MLFDSAAFVVFFLIVLLVSAVIRGTARMVFLILASYFFYGVGGWQFVPLLLMSTMVDFSVGHLIFQNRGNRIRQRSWLIVSLVTNLGLLGVFKYAGFFADGANQLAVFFGAPELLPVFEVALPAGISFYTFQSMSYSLDIFGNRLVPERSFLRFMFFVSFFPQLLAGPIVRAAEFLPQIKNARFLEIRNIPPALDLLFLGFFKKTVIADNLAPIVDEVYARPELFSAPELWMATIGFSIQIYCDFSGYSDIARGLARLFGYDLPVNFRAPYFSLSVREFWQRWHITLSFFLRDYVYIPLGGSRCGRFRNLGNLIGTWLLTGLWHGAGWNFILWGLLHGVALVFERTLNAMVPGLKTWVPRPVAMILTFCFVTLAWVPFRAEQTQDILTIYNGLFSLEHWTMKLRQEVLFYAPVPTVMLLGFLVHKLAPTLTDGSLFVRFPKAARVVAIALGALVIVVLSGDTRPFIYFRF